MRTESTGTILEIRAIEDCIRATRKYTKGAFSRPVRHPIQGEDFPSHVLTEHYEVYPDTEVGWDMPASDAWAWVWGDVPHINVRFNYNYQRNRAMVIIFGGDDAVRMLADGIPGFRSTLSKTEPSSVKAVGKYPTPVVDVPSITTTGHPK